MPVVKNKSTEENREFWSHVEAVAKEVRTWPDWMGNRSPEPNGNHEAVQCPEPKVEKD
jgi:ribulose kinase